MFGRNLYLKTGKNYIYAMLNAPRLWYREVGDTFTTTLHDLG